MLVVTITQSSFSVLDVSEERVVEHLTGFAMTKFWLGAQQDSKARSQLAHKIDKQGDQG
jgi:hypothetical protein